MTVAIVLGGALNVYTDAKAAASLFTPDVVVAVKDIGMTYPHVDHWVTYHPERLPRELPIRRKKGLSDPLFIWTYEASRTPTVVGIPFKFIPFRGGSSGFMGMEVGCKVADKVVLCGIPMDPNMKHFSRPKAKGWPEGKFYRQAWMKHLSEFKDRVRSMSGWTKEVLGEPTAAWLNDVERKHVL